MTGYHVVSSVQVYVYVTGYHVVSSGLDLYDWVPCCIMFRFRFI